MNEEQQIAQVLHVGLRRYAYSKQDVLAWADREIERRARPAHWIVELATSGRRRSFSVAALLAETAGPMSRELEDRIYLGILSRLLRANRETVLTVAIAVYKWIDTTPPDLRQQVEDFHARVLDGQQPPVMQEFQGFLLPFEQHLHGVDIPTMVEDA